MAPKKIKIIIASTLIAAALGYAGILLTAPTIFERAVMASIQSSCKSCDLKIGSMNFGIFPFSISFHTVSFRAGSPNISLGIANIDQVRFQLSLKQAFYGKMDIRKLILKNVVVDLIDGDGHSAPKPVNNDPPAVYFRIRETEIENGSFTYTRHYKGTEASLHIDQINGDIDELSNQPELRDRIVNAHATAVLEKSGKIDLKIHSPIFVRPPEVLVELSLVGQELAGTNSFFETNAGVLLTGQLFRGQSEIKVQNQRLKGWVFAKFDKLSLRFKKNAERSGTNAFWMNLGASIAMDSKNTDEKRDDQARPIELKREARESLVSFILRGMREAAFKITTAPSHVD